MIIDLGLFENLYKIELVAFQEAFSRLESKIVFQSAQPPTGNACILFAKDRWVVVERRDGQNHENEYKYTSEWHREGTADFLLPRVMFWANQEPTEFLIDDDILVFEPYHLIMIDNRLVYHRIPLLNSDTLSNRFFITARLNFIPTTKRLKNFQKFLNAV